MQGHCVLAAVLFIPFDCPLIERENASRSAGLSTDKNSRRLLHTHEYQPWPQSPKPERTNCCFFRLWRPQKFSPTLCARGTWYWNVAQTARASCPLLQQESLRPSCWSRTVTLRAANPQPGPDMVSSIMPIGTCQNLIIHKGFTCNTRSNLKNLYNNNLLIHLICFVQFGSF